MSQPKASPFSPLAALLIVAVGVFAFASYMLLSAFAPDLQGGEDGGAHALSSSSVGFAGIVQLLRNQDLPAEIIRKPLANGPRSILILTPGLTTDPERLKPFFAGGATLVVLPKWQVTRDPNNPGWVYTTGLADTGAIERLLAQTKLGGNIARRTGKAPVHLTGDSGPITTGPIDCLQTIDPSDLYAPMLADEHGNAILVRARYSNVAILSDPDLLDTQGIKNLNTARAAMAVITLLRQSDGPIDFDVSLDGFGSPPSLLKLILTPPYLGATLCLLLAALLTGLHAAIRFGPAREPGRAIALGKRALADNAAALIRLARREPQMAWRYAALSRAAVARALGATRLKGDELETYLDRIAATGASTERLQNLAATARQAKNRMDLLKVARDLHRWRREMTSERR